MLDVPEAETNGDRRVRDAMQWLEAHDLIRIEQARGKEPTCTLLSALGDGKDYFRPNGGCV
ncbi:hypothetical protein ABN034_31750 [Actinopolymorpha sp. B11F2]|uniref:hypothetical protein n=1 Tax=Actinopolymorpha sp. B11F2 TaxID=3160862 RepID=UPI0032E3A24E